MIAGSTRIVAIDDDETHLQVIVKGLNNSGLACLPIKHPSESVIRAPLVRLVFVDLHLIADSSLDHQRHFRTIETLLNELNPQGPYAVVLWTNYVTAFEEFKAYIYKSNIPKPVAIEALDKAQHVVGQEALDLSKLGLEITSLISKSPQINALREWEDTVILAANSVLANLIDLAGGGGNTVGPELDRLLSALGVAAVGQHVAEADPRYAAMEALAPLFHDQLSVHRQGDSDGLWRQAVTAFSTKAPHTRAAAINRMLHVALNEGDAPTVRGACVFLDHSSGDFVARWGIEPDAFLTTELKVKNGLENVRFLALQVQAGCDYAQRKPGLVPYILGAALPRSVARDGKPGDAIIVCPPFDFDGTVVDWVFHTRYVVGLPESATAGWTAKYRMRAQLLNHVCATLHSHAGRLGIMQLPVGTTRASRNAAPPPATSPAGPSLAYGTIAPEVPQAAEGPSRRSASRRPAATAPRAKANFSGGESAGSEAVAARPTATTLASDATNDGPAESSVRSSED